MADTVKKSRIVSEDDLEESLMQEFNMRLKTCMSSDKLNDEDDKNAEEAIYENVEIITSNGQREQHTPQPPQPPPAPPAVEVEEENEPLGQRNKLNSIEEFIQIERECLRLEQNGLIEENDGDDDDGDARPAEEEENDELLGPEEVEITPPDDADDGGEAPAAMMTTTETNIETEMEIIETLETSEPAIETKSVRDRMFLSTDSASCLLFTQTVTSPMLTPSEERIDFIKGFQTSAQNTISDDSNESPKSDPIEEIAEAEAETEPEQQVEEEVVELDIKSVDLLKDVPENYSNGHADDDEEEVDEEVEEEAPVISTKPEVVDMKARANPKQKYIETITKETCNSKEQKVTECKLPCIKSLKDQYIMTATSECPKPNLPIEKSEISSLKSLDIMKQISKFEQISPGKEDDGNLSTATTETTYVETTTVETKSSSGQEKSLKKKKSKKSRNHEKENISVKSSFSKFDALQKKNVLHVRSSDSSKAQEKFNGNQIDNTNCKSCGKIVFQMEQMKAEKSIWHKNCFRCTECNKQLTVDTYQSHEGVLYCKPHFKTLFAPKAVEDDTPQKPRKHEMIIRENQPEELPPGVFRASDKPDLGLEELQALNVKERFQVFEHHEDESHQELTGSAVNVKRSPSILSKLARFQAKGMDIGVADDSLNGIPIEESSSEEEEEEELDGEDADLIRAKRAQREKPFHFTGMSDVKSKWEQGADHNGRDERREERKQEIQSIRNRLFMGKQGKMKEAYQQAVMESESGAKLKSTETIEIADTRSLMEKFEKGQPQPQDPKDSLDGEDMSVFESGICKKSRSIFLELDANAAKAPQISPVSPVKNSSDVRKAREVYLAKQASEEVVKSTEAVEDVTVQTADIQKRFKFFEKYKEPEKKKKQFRMTPPRDGQVKVDSPEREVYRDPEVARAEEIVEDSVVAKQTQTAKKMLNKFRQMEEDMTKDQVPLGPKPLKRFTPPPEPIRSESESEEDVSETEEESDDEDGVDHSRIPDEDLIEAQKAARAKQLRAKFEKWEANEIKREQNQSSVNIAEEFGEEQSQIESTKSLRARFESMKGGSKEEAKAPRAKVNRFV